MAGLALGLAGSANDGGLAVVDDMSVRRRHRLSRPALLIAGFLAASAVFAGGVVLAVSGNEQQSDATVTFEVWGSGRELPFVIWRTPVAGQTQSLLRQPLPWSTTVKVAVREGPLFLNVVGDLDSRLPDEAFHCRISVNNVVMEEVGPTSAPRCFTTLQRFFTAR